MSDFNNEFEEAKHVSGSKSIAYGHSRPETLAALDVIFEIVQCHILPPYFDASEAIIPFRWQPDTEPTISPV
jgi:hypothetical protein